MERVMATETNTQLTLKVVEAQAKDVGRAIARIDPQDMEQLGLEVGGCVEIEGKRRTVAKVMPAYPDDRGKSTIQIDGLIRENAKAGLDEKVTITKVSAKPAEKLVLAPITLMRSARRGGDQYLGKLLEGMTTVTGDRIRASLFRNAKLRIHRGQYVSQRGPRRHHRQHHNPTPVQSSSRRKARPHDLL